MRKIFCSLNRYIKEISKKSAYTLKVYQYLRALRLLFNKSFRTLFFATKKGDICLDIGANVGDASLIFWLKGAKIIHAIEPHPIAFKELKKNLKGIRNIKFYNCAISNQKGLEKLYLHQEVVSESDNTALLNFSQSSSLINTKDNLGKNFFEINTLTIQDFIYNLRENPTIIKCDIEGAEYRIRNDLIKIAKDPNIRILLIECHAEKYKNLETSHLKFVLEIKKANLVEKFDLSWH